MNIYVARVMCTTYRARVLILSNILALYKSFTYLLTYLLDQVFVNMAAIDNLQLSEPCEKGRCLLWDTRQFYIVLCHDTRDLLRQMRVSSMMEHLF